MKVLVINPNISEGVTQRVQATLRAALPTDVQIDGCTASFGVEYIETRAEAAIGGHATLDLLATRYDGHDVVIIAAFGDPALVEARDLVPVPVIGLAQASLTVAALVARRVSILTIANRMHDWYWDAIDRNGMRHRIAAVVAIEQELKGQTIASFAEDSVEAVTAAVRATIRRDNADAVILAGAPLAGVADQVRPHVDVPLIDGVEAAARLAYGLAGLDLNRTRMEWGAGVPLKSASNLSPELAQALSVSQSPEPDATA